MTAKRFTLELYNGTKRIKAIKDNGEIIYPPKIVELLNELDEKWIGEFSLRETLQQELQRVEAENEQLKEELQRMYDVATLNKAIEVLENKYDKMLSDGSDEVKDAMRHTVLRCIEDLNELKYDIT